MSNALYSACSRSRAVLGSVVVLLAAACGPNLRAPTRTDSVAKALASSAASLGDADKAFLALETEMAGFGGLFIEDGAVFAHFTNPDEAGAHRNVLEEFAATVNPPQGANSTPFDPSDVRFLKARFAFSDLVRFRDQLGKALALPGVQVWDIDEKINRVTIVLKDSESVAALLEAAKTANIPEDGLNIRVDDLKLEMTATLQDFFRPTKGGNEVGGAGTFACSQTMTVFTTAGAFAGWNGFLTDGHCTNSWGVANGQTFNQPLASSMIGNEWVETAFGSIPGCPPGSSCKTSDAVFVGFTGNSAALGTRGVFHKPTTSCTLPTVSCGLTVSSLQSFQATAAAPTAVVGSFRNKIGRTTGWTAGSATSTCTSITFTHATTGQTRTFLCQDAYSMGVLGGDSGGPVFVQSNATYIQIAGQVIARTTSGPVTMYASPLSGITGMAGFPTFQFCAAGFGC